MATVVMTGGSSGLGAVARRRLEADATLLLGARDVRRRQGPGWFHLDLTKLADVRAFAAKVEDTVGERGIDALVLNAGGRAGGRTAEGYEATFVVNHLAHYLLVRLLWHRLRGGGTIVLTTSGTHDPAQRTLIPPPRHANALWLARPELEPGRDASPRTAAGRAYSSAKLCVLLTARALAAREDAWMRRIQVLAYDPGPTPGTGLVRDEGALVRFAWGAFAGPLRLLLRGANTVEDAGRTLADLALARARPPAGRVYAALRRGRLTWPEPSELARNDELMRTLWRDSAELVGIGE